MPKRKRDEDFDYLYKKLKKLEKKLRRCRDRSPSPHGSDFEEPNYANGLNNENADNNISVLLDGDTVYPANTLTTDIAAENDIDIPIVSVTNPSITENISAEGVSEPPLASDILEILGEDPTVSNTYGADIHKDLAVRLENAVTHGLSKDNRKELNEKYLIPNNCKLIDAPTLNPEIKVAINDTAAKRDKSIEMRQKQTAVAISCLGQALNKLVSDKEADPVLIKMLMDTERILCDNQHSDSIIRRNFILSSLKKDMKDQLQNTNPDSTLFGVNLSETIKTAKAINKSGAELKIPAPKQASFFNSANKRFPVTASTSKNLNWKGPYPARKPPNPPKTKEIHQNKNRQSNSSKPSQQRTRDRR